jgi:hypothetical protein
MLQLHHSMFFKTLPRNDPGSINLGIGLTKPAFIGRDHYEECRDNHRNRAAWENRPSIASFLFCTEPGMVIVLFTMQDISRIDELRTSVRFLPRPSVHVSNHQARSSVLTKASFWEQLAPVEHVLLFQSDSILCVNSHHRIEDFLEYDFVGTPDTRRGGCW